ncbi:MAG TPA: hypothetical protein VK447_09135 [Myxococcaceae bacterium]|nr:hypothetical protein [Myxococcaceae bacterium]
MTTDTLSMQDARRVYFEENRFGPDGGYGDTWVKVMVGPLPFWFPNTSSRVRAVRFHDLHHILTGYRTDFPGETEISAWELATGCADHGAAWVLNLAGMGAGLYFQPRAVFRAFVRGRHSQNLYRRTFDDALLKQPVASLRRELGLDAPAPKATFADVATFAGFVLASLATAFVAGGVSLAPVAAVAIGLWRLLLG